MRKVKTLLGICGLGVGLSMGIGVAISFFLRGENTITFEPFEREMEYRGVATPNSQILKANSNDGEPVEFEIFDDEKKYAEIENLGNNTCKFIYKHLENTDVDVEEKDHVNVLAYTAGGNAQVEKIYLNKFNSPE
jgi:hypothetical protein